MVNFFQMYLQNRFTVKTVVVGNVTAGQEIDITVPAGKRWVPLVLYSIFLTSATAATRIPGVVFKQGSTILCNSVFPATIGASSFSVLTYAHNAGFNFSGTSGMPQHLPLMALEAGESVETSTTSLQAGDQYTNVVLHYLEADLTEPS